MSMGSSVVGDNSTSKKSRGSLLFKVLIVGNLLLLAAVTLTGFFTYRVAKEALRRELVSAGRSSVRDFAEANALEWLDPEAGPLNLKLRLEKLLASDESKRVSAAYILDRNHSIMTSAGQVKKMSPLRPESAEPMVRDQAGDEYMHVGVQVEYSGTRLGGVVFSFNQDFIAKAGQDIIGQTVVVISLAIIVNFIILVLGMKQLLQPVVALGSAAERFAEGNFSQRIEGRLSNDEVGAAAESFNNMCDALEVHMRFSNGALVKSIEEGVAPEKGEEHQMTIVFGDAKGYTTWSEKRSPSEVFDTLTRYYTCFGKIAVSRFNGIIDKFMGDGVMAHFGLFRYEDDTTPYGTETIRDALRSTIYTQVAHRVLSHALGTYEKKAPLSYRFGIASGRCLIGAVGAKDIMLDYSPIGPVVNLAARLEGLAPAGGVVIDRFTYLDVGSEFLICDDIGAQRIKGIEQPVRVYAVRGFRSEEEIERMKSYLLDEFFDDALIDDILLASQNVEENALDIRRVINEVVGERYSLPSPLEGVPKVLAGS